MRLCSVGGCADAIVSHAPNARNPDTIGQGDFEAVVAGMACESAIACAELDTWRAASIPPG